MLGWIVLREAVVRLSWIAMSVELIGVLVMAGEGFESGSFTGNLLAFTTSFMVAGYAVSLSACHLSDMLSAAFFAGLFTLITSGLIAHDLSRTHASVVDRSCARSNMVQAGSRRGSVCNDSLWSSNHPC